MESNELVIKGLNVKSNSRAGLDEGRMSLVRRKTVLAVSQDITSQDIASQNIASQDIASQNIASQDIASQDTASPHYQTEEQMPDEG